MYECEEPSDSVITAWLSVVKEMLLMLMEVRGLVCLINGVISMLLSKDLGGIRARFHTKIRPFVVTQVTRFSWDFSLKQGYMIILNFRRRHLSVSEADLAVGGQTIENRNRKAVMLF